MKIRIITGLLLATLLLWRCDNREDYFKEINEPPQLTLWLNDTTSVHTISDSLKTGQNITLRYELTDEERLNISHESEGNASQMVINEENRTITITGEAEGKWKASFKVQDSFGEQDQAAISFTVFDNLTPVTEFIVRKVAVVSPYEIEVDASRSFDQDARFGGKIDLYEYNLNNYKFQTPLQKIRYIFGSSGQKKITVRVQDNNGDWSAENSVYYVLN